MFKLKMRYLNYAVLVYVFDTPTNIHFYTETHMGKTQ